MRGAEKASTHEKDVQWLTIDCYSLVRLKRVNSCLDSLLARLQCDQRMR